MIADIQTARGEISYAAKVGKQPVWNYLSTYISQGKDGELFMSLPNRVKLVYYSKDLIRVYWETDSYCVEQTFNNLMAALTTALALPLQPLKDLESEVNRAKPE